MPLKKLLLRPGVNKENTRYTSENGWYDCDKIRFRQGTPEKIGGWTQISAQKFIGVCRSLWAWVTLGAQKLLGVGTNLKFYIESGGFYYDITPINQTNTLTNPFAMVSGSSTVTVTDANGGYSNNGYVTFTGSSSNGGITLLGEYLLTYTTTANTYTVPVQSETSISIAGNVPIAAGSFVIGNSYSITFVGTTDFTLIGASANTVGVAFIATGAGSGSGTAKANTVFATQFQLANGVQVTLTSTGMLPAPYVAGTTYYVIATSGYTFSLSLTSGGAAIDSTGSTQSGICTVTAKASSTSAAGGGTVRAAYQIATGASYAAAVVGWGAGTWGSGTWGNGTESQQTFRVWSQSNFGEDLIFGPSGGGIYYWDASFGLTGTTFTVTIATPGVLSTSITLADGMAIVLTTTGALPTGLNVGQVYYVINSSGTSCNLSATYGGSAIATTGSQSGVHKISSRAIDLADYGGATDVPIAQNYILVSDSSRFVFAFGATEYGSATFNPMIIRWSDQGDPFNWTPGATVQAGFTYLSHGSQIITAMQARQEILVWTDSSLYSLQYVGAPTVWAPQIVGDNISIASENAVAYANGVAYWMGVDKFYKYDGRTQTQNCDLRQYVFSTINKSQFTQVLAGTNEGFNEIWWFYCSGTSTNIDSYVVFNYAENQGQGCWYYGSMARTAWLDSGLRDYPLAATYDYNIVNHEQGVDDNTTAVTLPIEAFITSAEIDLEDGDRFGFIWRVLPDITFRGSTATSPQVTMYLKPMQNSGSGYNTPASVGGENNATVTRTAILPIEEFTGQIYTRVRGRQIAMEVRSTAAGVTWQLGSPRIDIRQDGRR